jgi:hypothetical protein
MIKSIASDYNDTNLHDAINRKSVVFICMQLCMLANSIRCGELKTVYIRLGKERWPYSSIRSILSLMYPRQMS